MKIREKDIDHLLQARSEIDEQLQRHKTEQTVLFTDIVGSTTYFDRFGDTAGLLLLYRHHALAKDAVQDFKGIVVKTIGDSVMAEFADPLNAVYAAIALQRILYHHNQSLACNERVQIRIGINVGFGFRRANDLFGDIVNVAARITKRCGPAQILVSQPVSEMIPATEVILKSLGPVSLEGKNNAEELFEVLWMEEEKYDALRCNFSTPAPVDRVSRRTGRLVNWFRAIPGMATVKAAAVLAVYLTIAAGMVSGRADTKQPAIPDGSSGKKLNDHPRGETTDKIVIRSSQRVTAGPSEGSLASTDQMVAPVDAMAASIVEPLAINRRPKRMALIETVQIPSGVFLMGSDSGKKDEKPRHYVRLDRFKMSRTEITNRQYLAFLMETSYPRPNDPSFVKNYLVDYPNFPVVNVSYDDAMAFCAWASTKFNAAVRLPTEAEWEYAAVGGENGVVFPWGMQDPIAMARYRGNAPLGIRTVAETTFPPNGFGLYNMSGNVWEWVLDYYSKDYYTTSPIRNPKGPRSGVKHSVRGGSWAGDDSMLRVTRRASRSTGERSDQIGFRIVVSSNTR